MSKPESLDERTFWNTAANEYNTICQLLEGNAKKKLFRIHPNKKT